MTTSSYISMQNLYTQNYEREWQLRNFLVRTVFSNGYYFIYKYTQFIYTQQY
jgi:hypothetical protein